MNMEPTVHRRLLSSSLYRMTIFGVVRNIGDRCVCVGCLGVVSQCSRMHIELCFRAGADDEYGKPRCTSQPKYVEIKPGKLHHVNSYTQQRMPVFEHHMSRITPEAAGH